MDASTLILSCPGSRKHKLWSLFVPGNDDIYLPRPFTFEDRTICAILMTECINSHVIAHMHLPHKSLCSVAKRQIILFFFKTNKQIRNKKQQSSTEIQSPISLLSNLLNDAGFEGQEG